MHPLGQIIWGHIWKDTVEKSQTNVTNATMHPHRQAIWRHIWKYTVEKNQTNATNAITLLLRQTIWGDIWKRTVVKSQTNATNVTLHPPMQAFWGHICKSTVEKSWTNVTSVTLHPLMQAFWGRQGFSCTIYLNWHLLIHSGPSKCTICNLSSLHVNGLNRHILTHTGPIPKSYNCSDCRKSYSWAQTPKTANIQHIRPIYLALSSVHFKCVLKWPVWEDAYLHWLHLCNFSPLCVFKCVLKLLVCEDL